MRRRLVSVVFILGLVAASVWGFVGAGLRPQLGLDLVGGVSVVLTAPEGTASDVLDRTLETIRARVDAVGVAEPDITLQGELNIQVQIPRFEADAAEGRSQERLLELVGRTAQLEYRAVVEVIPPEDERYAETEITEDGEPDEEVVYPDARAEPGEEPVLYRLGEVLMTGEALSGAQAQYIDPAIAQTPGEAGWQITFDLTAEGGETFAEITREHVGQQLAVVLDERVESAPTIQQEITGRTAQITGDFTREEAQDLALVLRVGALPVELEQSQVETVSPTLGRESLRQGLVAGIGGLLILALYLVFYYRLLGIAALLGLTAWATLSLTLVALMGIWFGYSLTLAGVAGLVVSIGIAADSNIVLYERLKDEIRAGKTIRSAVEPAFRRAWRTIIAANLVTIGAAVILYLLAIGAVRGFALTLGLATALDMVVMYFFVAPLVAAMARNPRLARMRGMGLRAAVQAKEAQPVAGGGR